MTNITDYIANKPPVEWVSVLKESDFPHAYEITFGAFVATVLSLLLPFWFVRKFITFLANNILPEEDRNFLVDHFLPEL
jgi:hypothetical protein